jgi:electron transfer flavoprotein beta subunit
MKILVPVKRVVDYNVKIRVKADQSGVELANVKMAMNPSTKSPSKKPCA